MLRGGRSRSVRSGDRRGQSPEDRGGPQRLGQHRGELRVVGAGQPAEGGQQHDRQRRSAGGGVDGLGQRDGVLVEQHDVESRPSPIQRRAAAGEAGVGDPHAPRPDQQLAQQPTARGVGVDDQHALAGQAARRRRARGRDGPASAAAAGTVNVTVVPAPSLLRAVTVPPISSHSRRQIARPSPVPP